jgi:hypothetical protein
MLIIQLTHVPNNVRNYQICLLIILHINVYIHVQLIIGQAILQDNAFNNVQVILFIMLTTTLKDVSKNVRYI